MSATQKEGYPGSNLALACRSAANWKAGDLALGVDSLTPAEQPRNTASPLGDTVNTGTFAEVPRTCSSAAEA